MIAGKCGSLHLVLAGPVGCLRGRWRSGPRKWRHDAGSRARGQQAPCTCRCIKTVTSTRRTDWITSQQAPCTCRCIKTTGCTWVAAGAGVSKHRAPVGALRRLGEVPQVKAPPGQQAPCTCRCIKTAPSRSRIRRARPVSKHRAPVGALRLLHCVRSAVVRRLVSKHRAPVGALRPTTDVQASSSVSLSASTAHL